MKQDAKQVELAAAIQFGGAMTQKISLSNAVYLTVDVENEVVYARPKGQNRDQFLIPFDNVKAIVLLTPDDVAVSKLESALVAGDAEMASALINGIDPDHPRFADLEQQVEALWERQTSLTIPVPGENVERDPFPPPPVEPAVNDEVVLEKTETGAIIEKPGPVVEVKPTLVDKLKAKGK